jgi:hypothetical protein
MSAASRTIPAYGRAVIDARRRGEPVNLFVYCGVRCWEMAQLRQHGIAVPTPDDARRVDWRPIAGGLAGVTLVAREWDTVDVDDLARQLVRDGAKLVVTLRVESVDDVIRVDRESYRPKRRAAA